MEHREADESRAAERYLLGEMSEVEKDDFEEHFFSCTECAEAVKTGASFSDNAREVFREQPHLGLRSHDVAVKPSRAWWQRLSVPVLAPTFAALLFLCIAGYERAVIFHLQNRLSETASVQALPVFGLKPVFRSPGEQVLNVPANAAWFSLRFDAPEGVTELTCEIRDASGVDRPAIQVAASGSGDAHILLERSQFPAGSYKLTVRGKGQLSSESREYTFQLAYQ